MQNPELAILGTGWSFPPTFSRQTYAVEMVSADLDIRQSLWVLFSTDVGERVMVPEYGSQLSQMIFNNVTTTLVTQLNEIIRHAVLYWEPRIDVDEVAVQPDAGVDGLILITVYYTIRQTNARNNLVFPLYLREKTIPTDFP